MHNYEIAEYFNLLAKLMDIHGENAFKIATKMKKKSNGKICLNQLASLLNIRFNTKTTPSFDLTVINDFPKLKKKQLISGIFWGTFQLVVFTTYYLVTYSETTTKRTKSLSFPRKKFVACGWNFK